ncbi:conserved hypothetical protein [Desulfamplus magnetovallimortis]|uniref:TIGR02757 family protein n=1 Tax=Desulfamplus magnetovallimortis TaxID=1246637 RepID=A0A1W1H6P4_9BACT|nr:TIGR02757 family protein [Desulfamplus magnetovallimortis]SLM28143.1 conserved hypothetical protein [Desulfamplus magnetovallimortis]
MNTNVNNITPKNQEQLRNILETIHASYHKKELVSPDPLQFLYDYPEKDGQREIAAIIAAMLAYGRVEQIIKAVSTVLSIMNNAPYDYLQNRVTADIAKNFSDFRYRFTNGNHIANFLNAIKANLSQYGSLQTTFMSGLKSEDIKNKNIIPAMCSFVQKLSSKGETAHLTPDPAKGSACKRLNLFLRWMVRKDEVDPGGWDEIPPDMLIIPLDTHMHHAGKLLGFTKRKQANMKTALEITEGFRKICPEDPVKYDFSLTRFGIHPDMNVKTLEATVSALYQNPVF